MEVYNNAHYDDFIGFTFNGKHSSEFGLLRASSGDRYEDTFVPSLSDEAADIPGGPGQYYFGETIKEKTIPIDVAYDNIGERDKRRIKHWLHPDDKLHELVFDEKPYVKYLVKCSKQVVTSELCFDEYDANGNKHRVYKGEFQIEFTAYMPYGLAVDKDLKQFNPSTIGALYPRDNYEEWADSSGLIELDRYGIRSNFNGLQANVYNGGDVETGFEMTFEMAGKSTTFTQKAGYGKETDTKDYIYAPHYIRTTITEMSAYKHDNGNYYYLIKKGGNVSNETNPKDIGYYQIPKNIQYFCIFNTEGTIMFSFASEYSSDKPLELMMKYRTNQGEYIEGFSGKIINSNGQSKFESYADGQIYDLYYYGAVKHSDVYEYYINNASSKSDTTFLGKLTDVTIPNGNLAQIYGVMKSQLQYDSGKGQYYMLVTIPKTEHGDGDAAAKAWWGNLGTLQSKLGITSSVCDFLLKNGNNTLKSFRLSVPGISTTDTKYWSEAQKAIATGGQFKINTNKQTISYRQKIQSTDQWGEWIGLSGLISDGELFKIPTDIDKYLDGIDSSTKFNKIVIQHSNPQSIGNITNATISYEYLYI